MALDQDALGKKIDPLRREYTWRDVILYALAVGAGPEELDYCYEKELKVLPTFALASTFDFFWRLAEIANIDLSGILHGEQELIFHNPIPLAGTLESSGVVSDYFDKGPDKGALVVGTCETYHQERKVHLFSSIYRLFARFDGGFNGSAAPKNQIQFPDSNPDYVVNALPGESQHLLYRLTGDYFALHVDPDFARKSGFKRPIMHGACTFGYGCRALVNSLMPGSPERIKRLSCRFSKYLYPGVPIKTMVWKRKPGKAFWRILNAESGEILIDNGICEYRTAD